MEAVNPLAPIAAVRPAATESDNRNLNAGSRFLAQLAPGQRARATVREILSNSDFIVTLESEGGKALKDQLMHITLPPGVRPDDRLSLVLISREPRPQFALLADLRTHGDVFWPSETGGFIDRLLRSPSLANRFIHSSIAPLLGGPPDDPAELSLRLGQTLERSGLFYESHMVQWIAGKRALADLLLEPQARFPRRGSLAVPGGDQNAKVGGTSVRAAPSTQDSGRPNSDFVNDASVRPDQAPREALALMRQQLEVLETRQVAWQGEAWPGQPVALEFFEEDRGGSPDTDQPGQAPVTGWKTCLRLNLPSLGKITADLRLNTQGLEVSLAATDLAAAAVLQSGTIGLGRSLESAGITLLALGVDVDEEIPSA
ncbi:MAG TPA: flagellar hook-length control protein FliK [Nitrosospira sp.]|nr:flagellar hook-length control protein FliK [Nitrosospira sp.]